MVTGVGPEVATVLHALGVSIPPGWQGHPITETLRVLVPQR
jgi:hypothetical protein